MSDGKVLEFAEVSMVFGDVPAVDGLTARIEPGRVTAFLGPNGAGKTTTLRVLLGQLRPTRGTATIGGRTYHQIVRPAASIGAVMDIQLLDKARRKTATKYLTQAAKKIGVGAGRVSEVLTVVGLAEMADMRIGSLSLGMKRRLAVAEALLGDPGVLVFDEPANGLDPEGIRWIRILMRRFADEGRTVLMSSHLLSEVEQVADALLVLNEGELLFEGPIELLSQAEGGLVTVDADDREALLSVLDDADLSFRVLRTGVAIEDTTAAEVGALAAQAGVALKTLTHRGPTLEDIYLQIIEGTWAAPAQTAAMDPLPPGFVGDPDDETEAPEVAAATGQSDDVTDDAEAMEAAPESTEGDAADDADDATDGDVEIADPAESADAGDGEPKGGSGAAAVAAAALPGAATLASLAHDVREGDDADDATPAEEQAEQDAAAVAAEDAGAEPGDDLATDDDAAEDDVQGDDAAPDAAEAAGAEPGDDIAAEDVAADVHDDESDAIESDADALSAMFADDDDVTSEDDSGEDATGAEDVDDTDGAGADQDVDASAADEAASLEDDDVAAAQDSPAHDDATPAEEQAEQDAVADAAEAAGAEPGDDLVTDDAPTGPDGSDPIDGVPTGDEPAEADPSPQDDGEALIEGIPADVSPAVAEAFANAEALEHDMDDAENAISAAESRAEDADDDWEDQLRSLFDDESADDEDQAESAPEAPAAGFTGAAFGIAATRSIDISEVTKAPREDDADDDVLKDDLIGRDDA